MQVITPLDRFEVTAKTFTSIETQNKTETYNLLAQFEYEFELLILNPKEKS